METGGNQKAGCGCSGGGKRKSKKMSKRNYKKSYNKQMKPLVTGGKFSLTNGLNSIKLLFANTGKKIGNFFTRNKKHTTVSSSGVSSKKTVKK